MNQVDQLLEQLCAAVSRGGPIDIAMADSGEIVIAIPEANIAYRVSVSGVIPMDSFTSDELFSSPVTSSIFPVGIVYPAFMENRCGD